MYAPKTIGVDPKGNVENISSTANINNQPSDTAYNFISEEVSYKAADDAGSRPNKASEKQTENKAEDTGTPKDQAHATHHNPNNAADADINRKGDDHGTYEDDIHDTDPPAHYPRPGNGLARNIKSDYEGLERLVDDNTDVFCHSVYSPVGD